ncbi:MAG: hypothetical protein QW613_04085 [Thermoprotei archaeon]
MPLRTVKLLLIVSLLSVGFALPVVSGQQTLQPTTQPMLVSVKQATPWYDSPGLNLSYTLGGTYPNPPSGVAHYSGALRVSVLGLYPNGSLKLSFKSTTVNPLAPNGTVADDPFFPGYLPVLPIYMVLPSSFSVVAPGYALFFSYKGGGTFTLNNSNIPIYVYTVSASQGVGGVSPIEKVYYVSRVNGLIVYENLSNPYTNSTFTMRLESYSTPTQLTGGTLQFEAPVYAKPGAQLTYTTTGQPQENISYTTLFSEADGQFMFEKVNYVGGSPQTPAFFLDNYTQPLVYPAIPSFHQTIEVGVSLSLKAVLVYTAQTRVNTPAGSFSTYVYKNTSLGFEEYLDSKTGVAVFIETPPPGGFIELTHSNILSPLPPTSTIYLALGFAVVVAAMSLSAILLGRRARGRQSAYIKTRRT